jgi:CIC family chloride channel protein
MPITEIHAHRLPLERHQTTAIRRMLEHRWFPLVLGLVITGLGAASAALLLKGGLDLVGRARLRIVGLGPDLLLLPLICGAGGLMAGQLVQRLAPAACGSGIPQVMRFLRNRPVAMGFQVAVVKLVAGVVAIGSGFPLGPSGPSIQMGSSVGWEMARLLRAPPAFRRMIVAAGGGAGIAAVFGPRSRAFCTPWKSCCRGPGPW